MEVSWHVFRNFPQQMSADILKALNGAQLKAR